MAKSTVITNIHPDLFNVLTGKSMNYSVIISQFKSLGDPATAEGMAKFGITAQKIYGFYES